MLSTFACVQQLVIFRGLIAAVSCPTTCDWQGKAAKQNKTITTTKYRYTYIEIPAMNN